MKSLDSTASIAPRVTRVRGRCRPRPARAPAARDARAVAKAPIAGKHGIEEHETRAFRRWKAHRSDASERRGSNAEKVIEHEDEQQTGEERRHRKRGGRNHAADMVDGAALAQGAGNPERHGDEERERDRRHRELERRGKPGVEILEDRLAGHQRAAEIAVRELAQIGGELLPQRTVEQQRSRRSAMASGVGAAPAK